MEHETLEPIWTTVDRFFHPTDAHIAAGKLRSEGIPVFLLGINHASVNWLLSNALGGIRIQVPAQYVDEARKLLAEIAKPGESCEPVCPECGGSDTSAMSNSRKVAFLAIHVFSIPWRWRSDRRHCQSSGAEWKASRGD